METIKEPIKKASKIEKVTEDFQNENQVALAKKVNEIIRHLNAS